MPKASSTTIGRRDALRYAGAAAVGLAIPDWARAALTIEIIGGNSTQIPVTVLPFGNEERFRDRIGQVVLADLVRSGWFRKVESGSLDRIPTEPERSTGVPSRAVGSRISSSATWWSARTSGSRCGSA